jgi:hypothetical protein
MGPSILNSCPNLPKEFGQIFETHGREISHDHVGSSFLQHVGTTIRSDSQTLHSGNLGRLDTIDRIFTHQNVASLNVKTIGRHVEDFWIWFPLSYVIAGYDRVKCRFQIEVIKDQLHSMATGRAGQGHWESCSLDLLDEPIYAFDFLWLSY